MTAIRRQYFTVKVWLRERLVPIAYLYLASVFLTILSVSYFQNAVELAALSAAPLMLVYILASTKPNESE
jgi:hypothetical protein